MGTLFQTFNFAENKTNTPGNGGLYFEIPFFSVLLNNKEPACHQSTATCFFILTEIVRSRAGESEHRELRLRPLVLTEY